MSDMNRGSFGVFFVGLADNVIDDLHVLDFAELAHWNSIQEELVNFLECSMVALRNAQIGEYPGQEGSSTEDESNL